MGNIDFTAPRTVARFCKSDMFGRVLAGPVGSGKTVGCVMEVLRRAMLQSPGADGLRHTRFSIVRQTLKQLKDTVLKDCRQWVGSVGYWKVSDTTFYIDFNDVRSEWIFIPLENEEDHARLLSMQLTGAWLSEAIEMDISVLAPISGRCGRYPSGADGNPSWFGIIADTNMPADMSAWHQFMTNPPADWDIFVQPSGLSADAENLPHLLQTDATKKLPLDHPARLAQGRRYYERFVEMYGIDSDWVTRYVKAEYGNDPSGAAVYRASFKSDFHVVNNTILIPGYPLLVAQDFGRNPWSLICQPDHLGRLVVHEEVPAHNIGLEKHVAEHLRPRLFQDKYMGMKVCLVGDPAGVAKDTISEESSFDCLKRLGLPCFPAPTNDIDPRLRAVEALLGRQTNGGPSLIFNRGGCPFLIRAMGGGYRFTKTKEGALRAVPDKNDKEGFSHVSDALQYAALVVHGGLVSEMARRLQPRGAKKRPPMGAGGWT